MLGLLRPATQSAFLTALKSGDMIGVKRFLDDDAELTNIRIDGLTPLHIACRDGQKTIVEVLLAHGSGIAASEKNYEGMTPLHEACAEGHKDIAGLLLVMGANINTSDRRGKTPLDRALAKGHKDVADFLREKGGQSNVGAFRGSEADVAAIQSQEELKGRFYALMHNDLAWAVMFDNVETINNILTDNPMLVDARFMGKTPLHLAASMGKKQSVEALLAKGANVHLKAETEGSTPLLEAARNGFKEIVELLVAKGADLYVKDPQGKTPIQLAQENNHPEVVALLKARMGIQ